MIGRDIDSRLFLWHLYDGPGWRFQMALKIAVIGAGNIGGALVGGIVKSRIAAAKDIIAIDASDEIRRRAAAQFKVKTAPLTTPKALEGRGLIIVAVKPQIVPAVL